MNLKSQLLNGPKLAPVAVTVLGGEFPARRLSAARLNKHDKSMREFQTSQDAEKLNKAAAQFLLDSLLDEEDQPMSESVTAEDLMEVHTMVAINAAVNNLVQLNFLGDDAEDEAKKD